MAAKQRKVIITCAATGSIHTPSMSPHIPLTPSEIAEQSIEAAEAGAAIIHLHARNPEDGSPTPSPDVFMEFLPRIKQSCKAVVNITTGGGHGMTLEERLAGAMRTKPEMSSLNMGSMNFGLFPMLDRYSEFKYEWERKHLENSLYAGKGRLAKSNAEQVRIVRSIIENLSLEVASPDEAREVR